MVKTSGREYNSTITTPQTSSRTTARKLKNKVGSPAARASRGLVAKAVASSALVEDATSYPSSDEFQFSDEDDAKPRSASPFASASVTSQSSGGSRSKLPLNLQLTLLKDIQREGGIDKFHLGSSQALSFLCDTRPELYGARGDKVRERIRAKVQRWKRLDKDHWYSLLLAHNVTELPSKNPTNNEKPRKEPQAVNSTGTSTQEAHYHDAKPASVPFKIPTVITTAATISKPAATKMSSTSENTRKCSSPCFLLCRLVHLC